RTLAREMGLDPDQETRALYARIRAAGAARPHKILAQPTPIVGREEELASVTERLEDPACRLVTLVGPGGIGKTRLALQAAAEDERFFLHGVCLVPLGAVSATEYLPSTVANALGIQFQGSRPPEEQLMTYLQEKELLLVMDGFEHLVSGALLVAGILDRAPHVKILVTSRERLNLQVEWLLDVPGLACPAPGVTEGMEAYSAVQLFVQRARQIQPAFALSEANQAHIARICRTVEGTPLGIQLASGWVRTLSCQEIADQVEHDLDFLTTSLRDVPAQHQSQRAIFQRSWALLSEGEQEALARLSVFQGPFTRQAAESVAGTTTATLASLVNKSLVGHNLLDQYGLHQLVKQYAAEALSAWADEPQRTQDLHCHYYTHFLHTREVALKGAGQPQARAEIQEVMGDVRAAWHWAAAWLHLDLFSLALDSVYLFYRAQGQFVEGREMLALAAGAIQARGGEANLLRLRIETRLADLCSSLGEYDRARSMIEASLDGLERIGPPVETALACATLGRAYYRQGEFLQARGYLDASVKTYRTTGDRWGLAQALNDLANVLVSDSDEYDQGRRCYEESLSLSRETGDQSGVARALLNLGAIEFALHHTPEAESLYEQAAAISREIGDRRNLAIALSNLGHLAYRNGAYERAAALVHESLDIKQESGDRYSILFSVMYLGNIACKTGQIQEARQWYDQVLRLASAMGSAHLSACGLECVARLCIALGELTQAVEMLQLALKHAGTDGELIDEINKLLAELEQQIPEETMAASRRRGESRQLEDVVEDLLTRGLPGMSRQG
ncbi:MAG: tetratricopeptide repeat protein, partial [Anaerolineae bacterium]|nr:tetratricopeptide repeat protein [Anaerolineae bacterium]